MNHNQNFFYLVHFFFKENILLLLKQRKKQKDQKPENNLMGFWYQWWKIRLPGYLLRCPRSRLVVSLTNFLTSSHEWNYAYENHSFFSQHKSLDLRFHGEKQNFQEKKNFCFFIKKNCILSWFSRIEEKHISSLPFSNRRKNTYSLSLVFQEVFSHREIKWKKNTHFLFLF